MTETIVSVPLFKKDGQSISKEFEDKLINSKNPKIVMVIGNRREGKSTALNHLLFDKTLDIPKNLRKISSPFLSKGGDDAITKEFLFYGPIKASELCRRNKIEFEGEDFDYFFIDTEGTEKFYKMNDNLYKDVFSLESITSCILFVSKEKIIQKGISFISRHIRVSRLLNSTLDNSFPGLGLIVGDVDIDDDNKRISQDTSKLDEMKKVLKENTGIVFSNDTLNYIAEPHFDTPELYLNSIRDLCKFIINNTKNQSSKNSKEIFDKFNKYHTLINNYPKSQDTDIPIEIKNIIADIFSNELQEVIEIIKKDNKDLVINKINSLTIENILNFQKNISNKTSFINDIMLKIKSKFEDETNSRYQGMESIIETQYNLTYQNLNYYFELLIDKEIEQRYKDIIDHINAYIEEACLNNDVNKIQSLINYSNDNNIILNLNRKNEEGNYPLLISCLNNSIDMVKMFINYSNDNNIILNVNEKDEEGNYPLLISCINNNIDLIQLFIDYANKNNIILNINEKNKDGKFPLLIASNNGNVELINLLVKNSGLTPLMYSIKIGNEEIIENLINLGTDINEENIYGITPLMYACDIGDENIIEKLADLDADVNKKNKFGISPLSYISERENIFNIVKILIESKVNIDEKNYNGETLLMNACKSKNFKDEEIKYLIKNGAAINIKNNKNETALYYACRNNKKEIVKYLLEKGIKFLQKNSEGKTALDIIRDFESDEFKEIEIMLINYGADMECLKKDGDTLLISACKENDIDKIKRLIDDYKANINFCNKYYNSPLIIASKYGNEKIINYLISKNAFINHKGEYGISPITTACYFMKNEIISLLIKEFFKTNNANLINEHCEKGNMPLIIACSLNNKDLINLLIQKGADVNIEDNQGNSPLSIACQNKNMLLVMELIKKGADVNKENKNGKTPLMYACDIGNENIIEILVNFNVDINIENKYGITPLMYAIKIKKENIIEKLVNLGADINSENSKRLTPLIYACNIENDNIIKILVKLGADIYKENSEGLSPLIHLKFAKKDKLIEELNDIQNSVGNSFTNSLESSTNMKSNKEDLKDIIHDNETNNHNTLDEQSFNGINNNRNIDIEKKRNKSQNLLINFNKLLKIANNSVFKIELKKEEDIIIGTGFFVEIEIENEILRGLMTNNHILGKKILNSKSDSICKIYFEERREFNINSEDMDFVFTDKLIDVTFIQLKKEKIDKINPNFLKIEDSECTVNESIINIQYPIKNESLNNINNNNSNKICDLSILQERSIASGSIEYSSGINYCHSCPTREASSGSPLINNSLKVVAIHKSSNSIKGYATKMTIAKYAIHIAYIRKNNNEINNATSNVKKLTKDNLEDMKKHNLIQINNNIFKLEGHDSIPSFHFYRTNSAWYWTNQTIDKHNDGKIEIKSLRQLQWTIIIPHEKVNDEYLMPIHKHLIMWLRLSEFMYL